MATNTPRLQLRKPADNDNVDQDLDLNDNFDKIDTWVTALEAPFTAFVPVWKAANVGVAINAAPASAGRYKLVGDPSGGGAPKLAVVQLFVSIGAVAGAGKQTLNLPVAPKQPLATGGTPLGSGAVNNIGGGNWQPGIVVYDSVSGGAGVIVQNGADIYSSAMGINSGMMMDLCYEVA